MEQDIQHIEDKKMILNMINRMSDNSFKTKLICVALLEIMFLNSNNYIHFFFTSILVINTCLFMDFYYLRTEILYRTWYNLKQKEKTLKPEWLFLLNPKDITTILGSKLSLRRIRMKAIFSWSVYLFYLSLFICVFVLSIN